MIFLQASCELLVCFHKLLAKFLQTSGRLFINSLQSSQELHTNFFFSQTTYEPLKNLLGTSNAYLTNLIQITYKLLKNFLGTSHGPLKNNLQTWNILLICLHWTSYKLSYEYFTTFLQTFEEILGTSRFLEYLRRECIHNISFSS